MGVTVIYLHELENGRINVSAESVGECDAADELASHILQGLLLLQGVYYAERPADIAAHPMALEMQ